MANNFKNVGYCEAQQKVAELKQRLKEAEEQIKILDKQHLIDLGAEELEEHRGEVKVWALQIPESGRTGLWLTIGRHEGTYLDVVNKIAAFYNIKNRALNPTVFSIVPWVDDHRYTLTPEHIHINVYSLFLDIPAKLEALSMGFCKWLSKVSNRGSIRDITENQNRAYHWIFKSENK